MPSFSVKIRVNGPFRDVMDGARFDEAYSHRIVTASDSNAAKRRAISDLRREPQFAHLKRLDGLGAPEAEIDTIRPAHWLERFSSGAPLVFCRRTAATGER